MTTPFTPHVEPIVESSVDPIITDEEWDEAEEERFEAMLAHVESRDSITYMDSHDDRKFWV